MRSYATGSHATDRNPTVHIAPGQTTSGRYTRVLMTTFEREGMDPKAICERANLDCERLCDPDSHLTEREMVRLWEAAIEASLDESHLSFALPGGTRCSRLRYPAPRREAAEPSGIQGTERR